ncbi:PREDICTED: uncharacterized protein LOC109162408 [Ipomoea nil]|uniref:uncharacterized protein LOC109162408 n=1 Tax=Ipomoea nil TaxID=35883 RepID=UPI000901A4FB|nr:PREDICTED: uncharacterized protein LOC109162408 [Ipomoea nil]
MATLAEFQHLEETLNNMEAQDDAYWRQRAKHHWLKNANASAKFYHRYASHRRKKNILSKLMNDDGEWVEGSAMQNVVLDYFGKIFCSSSLVNGEPFFQKVAPWVTQAQNEMLLRPFEIAEGGFFRFYIELFEYVLFAPDLNNMDVVLIPKKTTPELVTYLRPIALSNVVYRVMAKMIPTE